MGDQRLLPRIVEGEVRMQMVKDELFAIIHKKPTEGGMSAVGGISQYTFYEPDAPEFADLKTKLYGDIPKMVEAMGLGGEPLPLLWTADFIPVDGHVAPMVVGEFNCSCVGISAFGAACGPEKDLKDVSFNNFVYAASSPISSAEKRSRPLASCVARSERASETLTERSRGHRAFRTSHVVCAILFRLAPHHCFCGSIDLITRRSVSN